jgi:hypothetical protein
MTSSNEEIFYAESCRIEELDLSLVHEFVFGNVNDKCCNFAWRFLNTGSAPVSGEIKSVLFERMQQMAECLKAHCEKDQEAQAS